MNGLLINKQRKPQKEMSLKGKKLRKIIGKRITETESIIKPIKNAHCWPYYIKWLSEMLI